MRRATPTFCLSAVLFVGLFSVAGSVEAAPDRRTAPPSGGSGPIAVGQVPPPLSLERMSGSDAVSLSGLSGQVVVLDFWATWCRPCQALMPALDALYQQHHQNGLAVVGLSPEPAARIRAYLNARPVRYTVARDIGGTMQAYGVRAIPSIVVIGRAGKVREIVRGVDGTTLARLDAVVTRLLAEQQP